MEFVCQNVIPFSRELVWQRQLFPAVGKKKSKGLEERAAQSLERALIVLNDQLMENNFISGPEISLADFLVMPSIEWYKVADFDLVDFGSIQKWLKNMKAEPAWSRVE